MNLPLDTDRLTMSPPLDTERLLRESAPVAAVLFFWNIFSESLFFDTISSGIFWASIVMALLYVVVRGVELAESAPVTPQSDDIREMLYENIRVAVPTGVWFLGSHVLYILHTWEPIPGLDTLAFAFSGAGVGVVLLYALIAGLPEAVGDTSHTSGDATGATPADD